MSDSSNGCVGSNQAYDRLAKCSLEILDVQRLFIMFSQMY